MSYQLHNAMWPGLVGKQDGTDQPPIDFDTMLSLTKQAQVNGRGFDGIDLFLFFPHLDIDAGDDEIRALADKVAEAGLKIGSVVAPIWPDTGGGSAFGSEEQRKNMVEAVRKACRYVSVLNDHGVRSYGSIRIDSAGGVADWVKDPQANTQLIIDTFSECANVAEDANEVLVAEGEVCWGGMHSWRDMLDVLEGVNRPGRLGFQADLAHTYLYLLGVNAPDHALWSPDEGEEAFWVAYQTLTDALGPWTYDFHVAQNDGTVHGSGNHDKTGRHCKADDPNGKLNIPKCAYHWLFDKDGKSRNDLKHLCWDGCMFDNADLLNQETWNTILGAMMEVNDLDVVVS